MNKLIRKQYGNINTEQEIKNETQLYKTMSNDKLIDFAYQEFKSVYKNKIKKTTINAIVDGEIISTKEENIFVTENCEDEDFKPFNDKDFDKKLKLSTKNLYNYQISAIKKLRELEQNGFYVNQKTKEKIYSNGWLLRLPIGSGKSLVFMFLSLIYKTLNPIPIIVSTSGIHIPEAEMVQLKYYPYYYENVGYIEGKENSVVMLKDYVQRQMTVVITHRHLLSQLDRYIKTDFKPSLLKCSKIKFVTNPREIDMNVDILITIGENDIIKELVKLSYEKPFMRIIVDDYTNMSGVDEFRQIFATSTIFVSGSGYERENNKIPPSYYTLKFIDVEKYSLVSDPEETKKGILRDSVATFNLIGSETEFSTYSFVKEIEEFTQNRFNLSPNLIYPFIENNGNKLADYFSLNFLIKNLDRFANAVNNVEKDLKENILDKNRVKYYLKWKETMTKKIKEDYYAERNGKQMLVSKEIDNPLTQHLFKIGNNVVTTVQSLVQQKCCCCNSTVEQHYSWGFVSSCCGSFFCSNCLNSMNTNEILLKECDKDEILKHIVDKNNYYCVVCHHKNPRYYLNSSRHKRTNIHPYTLIEEYMDVKDISDSNGTKFDYYFKMFLEGFESLKHDGKKILVELEEDYEKKYLDEPENYNKLILPLYSKDRLSILAINQIEHILSKLEIKPFEMNKVKPMILVYGCPEYMKKRVSDYFKVYSTNPKSSLFNLDIMFKNNMGSLIGLHGNILGILVWNEPDNLDEIQQLIGRILRLNDWNNPLYFYITCRNINCKSN